MTTDEGKVAGAKPGQPEPQTIPATQVREWILKGERGLPKREGGYLITGDLDLVSAAVEHRVVIHGAVFEGMVDASEARFGQTLDLRGCTFRRGLRLDCAQFDPGAHLSADGLQTDGLCSAEGLWLKGGDFCAANASIGGDLRLSSAELHGRLEMPYARIHGALFLQDSEKEAEKTPVPVRPFPLPTQADQDARNRSARGLQPHGEVATVLLGELEGRAFKEEIGEFGEFAHDRHQGDFGRFASGPQPLVERT